MAMAVDDDGVLPPGLAPEGENDDDIREDAAMALALPSRLLLPCYR
jgi:hypothetical protein